MGYTQFFVQQRRYAIAPYNLSYLRRDNVGHCYIDGYGRSNVVPSSDSLIALVNIKAILDEEIQNEELRKKIVKRLAALNDPGARSNTSQDLVNDSHDKSTGINDPIKHVIIPSNSSSLSVDALSGRIEELHAKIASMTVSEVL